MALKPPATPLFITLVQGAADAFVQASVVTGLSGRQAYNLKGIALQITNNLALVNNQNIQVALSRRSKTAQPNLADSDVLFQFDHQFFQAGAAYAYSFGRWHYFVPPLEVPIVEETIYAQLDSAATAVVNTVILRLDLELDTISDIDRLNLITRSLT